MCELCERYTDEELDAACARFEQAADAVRLSKLPRAGATALRKGTFFLGLEGVHSAVLGLRVTHRGQGNLLGYTAGYLLTASIEEIRDDLEAKLGELA